jgi:high-affinity iron transporter
MIKFILFAMLFFSATDSFALSSREKLYAQQCALCHGPNGQGDGPVGMALSPVPKDFNKILSQGNFAKKEVLKKYILGILKNKKNGSSMPSFESLPEQDKIDISEYIAEKFYRGK